MAEVEERAGRAFTIVSGNVAYIEPAKSRTWLYLADDAPIKDNPRPCRLCDRLPTPDGHDPCIANLPGVEHACCGHGWEWTKPYVQFETGEHREFENLACMLAFFGRDTTPTDSPAIPLDEGGFDDGDDDEYEEAARLEGEAVTP